MDSFLKVFIRQHPFYSNQYPTVNTKNHSYKNLTQHWLGHWRHLHILLEQQIINLYHLMSDVWLAQCSNWRD
jgi:hypothetical protein